RSQPADVRTGRECPQDGRQPHDLGVPGGVGVVEGGRPTRRRAVAATSAATAGSGRRVPAGGGARAGGKTRYPAPLRYGAPRSLGEALELLAADDEAKVLAGGQSLVPMVKLRFAAPTMLVDLNTVPGLDYHRVAADGTIEVGALCRHVDLEFSDVLPGRQP